MKRINPEKELRKIQHGNRNKVIFGVLTLLLIIGISSSYALYQVRYSKRIIYTKVAPFSTSDLDLAIYVDGNEEKQIPTKGTAYYEGFTCDNEKNLIANWNYKKWIMTIPMIELPNKCSITFSSNHSVLRAQIQYLNETNPEIVVDDETVDNNLRYIGKNPNNYVWFNCDNYDNLTQSTAATKCEKWRIVGLMNNMTKSDGTIENLVKIIREDSIGNYDWDTVGTNNWVTASLQKFLNGNDGNNYLNPNYSNNSVKGITITSNNMIQSVVWKLGGMQEDSFSSNWYIKERSTEHYGTNPTEWPGKIGLIYPSDYGYATAGSDSGIDRATCLKTILNSYQQCDTLDWLSIYGRANDYWTLTPMINNYAIWAQSYAFRNIYGSAHYSFSVRPSLYLKSSVKILDGKGTSTEPYILTPQ